MINSNDAGINTESVFNQAIQYGTSGNADGKAEYIGLAVPGTARENSRWLIKKNIYDSSGRVTDVKIAIPSEENYFSHAFVNPENLEYGTT